MDDGIWRRNDPRGGLCGDFWSLVAVPRGDDRKTACVRFVQFIGYGGAIVLAWFGARQLSDEPPEEWKWLIPIGR